MVFVDLDVESSRVVESDEDEDDPLVPCGENLLNLGVWQGARNHYIGSHRTGAPRPRTWTVTWRSRSPSGKGLARPW